MSKQKHTHTPEQDPISSENPDDRKLLDWLQSSLKEKEDIAGYSLRKIFGRLLIREDDFSHELQKEMWTKISSECQPRKKTAFLSYKEIIKYAAMVIILLIPAAFIYFNNQKAEHISGIDYQSMLLDIPELTSSSGNITIILPDNETIEIKDDEANLTHDDKGDIIVNGKDREETKRVDPSETQWLQLNVPYGKNTRITMSDGTKIWVNSGSRLLYPAHFAEDKRELYVEGEISLEVAPHKKYLSLSGRIGWK